MKGQLPISVITVDDHPLFRLGIKTVLRESEQPFNVLGEAGNEKDMWEVLNNKQPDILILDIILPDTNGIKIAYNVKKKYPEQKIMLLSSDTSSEILEDAILLSVDGFIDKMSLDRELVNALVAISQGEQFWGKRTSTLIREVLQTKMGLLTAEKRKTVFTEKEEMVVQHLCSGLSNRDIALQLELSHRTIETYRANVYRKLNINNTLDLLRYAIKYGIVQI